MPRRKSSAATVGALAALVAMGATGCAREPSYEMKAESRAELERRSAGCAEAARSADAARFAGCFAEDAALIAPGLLLAGSGPEAIPSALEQWMRRPGFRLELAARQIEGVEGREGNAVAMESGRYTLDGPEGRFDHTYSIKWVREPKGAWRADLLLLDVPEPAPPAP